MHSALQGSIAPSCRYIAIKDRSSADVLPDGLQQYKVVTSAAHKPHALVALLHELCAPDAASGASPEPKVQLKSKKADKRSRDAAAPLQFIVFVSSVKSSRRVAVLLGACAAALRLSVHELSSRVSTKAQAAAVAAFQTASRACAACWLAWPTCQIDLSASVPPVVTAPIGHAPRQMLMGSSCSKTESLP
jgi:superfamily II DNA/RNA helicase